MKTPVSGRAAAAIRIIALGASNTAGDGVGMSAAWPAQLEALLRARGYDVSIGNAGINGDDTSGILARVDRAVPDGTHIVILDKAAGNDRQRGIDSATNVAAITAKLQARQIKVLVIADMHDWANRQLQPDGIHITAAGHGAVAARLLPLVIAVIGQHDHSG